MKNLLKLLNVLCFVGVIVVNTLANTISINGKSTGEISAEYENLFTPAGFTFSIWSVIYIGLLAFVIYQFIETKISDKGNPPIASYLGSSFLISCLANMTWLFAWHYQYFDVSVICMVILLLSLIDINKKIWERVNNGDSGHFIWMVRLPFGLYLGWICIATVANVSVFLTAGDWGHWGISEVNWAVIMIAIGTMIGLWLLSRLSLIPAAAAIAWGVFGIYMKQWQKEGASYLMITCLVMITLLILGMAKVIRGSMITFNKQS